MFTGLIEEVGTLRRIEHAQDSARLEIGAHTVLSDIHLGDSVAVNGVCLTVVKFSAASFTVDAVPETMRMTNLGRLTPGNAVNLERALAANGRFGGHIVAGHVDGVGVLRNVDIDGMARVLTFDAPTQLMRYVVSKGSICINGVSLTVMDTQPGSFRVSVIPHTGANTTLLASGVGTLVNLECDVVAKYVEKLLTGRDSDEHVHSSAQTIDLEFLQRHGFS